MKKILIVNSNYYKDISKNLVIKCKKNCLKLKVKINIIERTWCTKFLSQ